MKHGVETRRSKLFTMQKYGPWEPRTCRPFMLHLKCQGHPRGGQWNVIGPTTTSPTSPTGPTGPTGLTGLNTGLCSMKMRHFLTLFFFSFFSLVKSIEGVKAGADSARPVLPPFRVVQEDSKDQIRCE